MVTAAGEDPCCDVNSSFALYGALFKLYGAAKVYYVPITVHSKLNNSNPDIIAEIKTMSGFFFGGGDQERVIYSFYNNDERSVSPALAAIKETLLSNGGVIGGTSAGNY